MKEHQNKTLPPDAWHTEVKVPWSFWLRVKSSIHDQVITPNLTNWVWIDMENMQGCDTRDEGLRSTMLIWQFHTVSLQILRLETDSLQVDQQMSVCPRLRQRLIQTWLACRDGGGSWSDSLHMHYSVTSKPFTAARKSVKAKVKDPSMVIHRKLLTPYNLHWRKQHSTWVGFGNY